MDSKGVKRGACTECTECLQFEWHKDAVSSVCTYCGCYPTKHKRYSEDNKGENATSSSCVLNNSSIETSEEENNSTSFNSIETEDFDRTDESGEILE